MCNQVLAQGLTDTECNGRIARLLANVPLLKAGLAPLVIEQTERRTYIQTLADYQIDVGQLNLTTGVWPNEIKLKAFEKFCKSAYSTTQTLLEKILLIQAQRKQK